MGNEMGNSNTSGLQEEENSTTQTQERFSQEAGDADGAEGKNHIVHVSEVKDHKGKVNGLASDVPNGAGDSPGLNQTSDRREQEETEVNHPGESPIVDTESNEVGDETSEIQQTFPYEDSKDHKNPPCYVNDGQENHRVDVAEGKDYHEKENGFTSDDLNGAGDTHFSDQIPEEKEQEETEIDSPAKSPTVETIPNTKADGETSEIRATSPSKDIEDDVKLPIPLDDAEVENGIVSLAECQEYNERGVNGMASDVPKGVGDPHVAKKISDEREQEDTELGPPAEFHKVEVKLNHEADGKTSDIKPTSPSTDSTHLGILQESILEQNLPQLSDHQLLKQDSTKKEDEGEKNATFDTISSSKDPEPQESIHSKFDQSELITICADPPVEDSNKSTQRIEDILGSNFTCTGEENGQPIDTNTPKDMGESVDSVSDPKVDVESDEITVKEVAPEAVEDSNKSAQRIEDILGSNLTCTGEENGQPIDTNIAKDMGESVVSVSDPKADVESDEITVKEVASEVVSCEERLGIKDGDEISNGLGEKKMLASESSSGVGIDCSGEQPTEINQTRSDSPNAEGETISMDKSLKSHLEVSVSTDDCMVLAEETVLITNESEHGESKANHYPTQSCEELFKGSNIDKVNVSMSEGMMMESKPKNNEKRIADYVSCDSGNNEELIKEAKVAEDDHLVDAHINDQALVEPCQDSQKENAMVPESEVVMKESSRTDCKAKEVPEEKEINKETEETTRASEGKESQKQCVSPTLPVEQNEAFLPMSPVSLVQPQDSVQNHEKESEKIQSSNISEIKQEGLYKSFVTEASSCDPTNLMAETLVSVDQLFIEKSEEDRSQYTPEITAIKAEFNTQANHFSGQGEKVETLAFATDDTQAQESMERLSTESNPNASNIQVQMQKSPSFGLDLRIEARTEESDQTPLLYREKTAIEDYSSQADVSLGNTIAYTEHGQDKHVYQAIQVEEEVVKMERNDSERSKTPFLGFLKEEEEAHIIVTPQKHDSNNSAKKRNKEFLNLSTKEVASTSPKSKEKRKPRSFLFTNCMCCTTVIN